MSSSTIESGVRQLDIEFLFLDLDSCTRCKATDATLLEALERAAPALESAGVTVSVTKTLVDDEELARRLRFASSPTIRINGVDVAGELVESTCESCGELCACAGEVACRDWLWRGERSTEPPVGLIVEAIMRHAAGPDASVAPPAPNRVFELPENLRHFYTAAASRTGTEPATQIDPVPAEASCCTTPTQASCCGDTQTTPTTTPKSCGCQPT